MERHAIAAVAARGPNAKSRFMCVLRGNKSQSVKTSLGSESALEPRVGRPQRLRASNVPVAFRPASSFVIGPLSLVPSHWPW